MTSQLRGGPGHQPTQSKPIPDRFSQSHFGPSQAYSPRLMQSSPLQHQQYYQQQPGPPHDMYKGAPGTSPAAQTMMMPQQTFYTANSRRPRGPPMQPMSNPSQGQFYYQPMMPRFPNMPPTSTSAAFYSPGQPAPQYPYLAHGQQIPFSQGYSQQYVQPPPNQAPITQMQQVAVEKKRERRPVRIVDPNTNLDVTDDIIKNSQKLDSLNSSDSLSATSPTSEIASKFAAQVADVARIDKAQEQQIPGPLVGNAQMGTPNPGYINTPPSSPHIQVVQQSYVQPIQTSTIAHPSSQGHPASPSQMQHGQMGFVQPTQEQRQPAAGYQLAPQPQAQQFAASMQTQAVRPATPHVQEHVQTYRSQPSIVANGNPALSQHAQSRTARSRPPVHSSSSQQSQPVVQRQILSRPSSKKDAADTNENVIKTATPAAVVTTEQKDPEPLENDTPSCIPTTDTETNPSAQTEHADVTEDAESKASSASMNSTAPTAPVTKTLSETDTKKEEQAPATEPVLSMPDDCQVALEKEDTAIRLDHGSEVSAADGVTATEAEAVEPLPAAGKECPPTDASANVHTDPPLGENVKPSAEEPALVLESDSKPEVEKAITSLPGQAKSFPTNTEEQAAPVPSGKATIEKLETEPASAKIEKFAVPSDVDEKTKVKSPEPQQSPVASDSCETESNKKDSVSTDSTEQSKSRSTKQAPQRQMEQPVTNGLLPDESTQSDVGDKGAKKSQEVQPSSKASKSLEVNLASDGKPKDAPRSQSVSSEKAPEKVAEKRNGVTSDKSKSASQEIKYDNHQWSPANPDGKRQYDSNFLLQFQYRQTSLEKPKDLPNIDIVLEQPHKQIASAMQPMELRGPSDFTPNFMRGPIPRRGPGRQNSRDYRPGRSSMSGPSSMKKVVSIDRGVELKTTANAWKPIKRDPKLSSEEQDTLGIIKDVRAILNKLTPSTFDGLSTQVLDLKIDTEKKLRGTIDLIFEKAIDEPNFSEMYAILCRKLTSIQVTPETVASTEAPALEQTTVEFRKLLLTRCQREFEKNKSDQEHLLELKKKMEENTDTELAPQLKEEYEYAEAKERRRTLGNIRFIGELFKRRMLTESIMHNCIIDLFKAKDDDHLESLCRLLTTIGKDLDHQKGKSRMDQIFDKVMKIIQEKRTSSRVRFMLQDVYDLRQNKWIPRAIQTQGPKTISQIHQDAKNEEQMLQMKLATTPVGPPQRQQGGRQQGRMGSRSHGEDGWTKVAQAPKPTRYDPNKMKLKLNQFDSTNVTLGPSREFGKWKSGSAGSGITRTGSSGYSPSASMDRTSETGRSNTPTNMMNRFSALSLGAQGGQDYDYQRYQGGRQSSRENSRTGSRGNMGPPSSSGPSGRYPRRDERSQLLETARQMTYADRGFDSRPRMSPRASPRSSPRSSREASPSVTPRHSSTPRQQPVAHQYNMDLDETKMQKKSQSILDEFLSIVDFKEATECLEELNAPPSLMHAFVYIAHEFTLEKKKEERLNIGKLMAHLLKRGRLSIEQYVKGLAELLAMATEYEIDIPKIWECLAEQLAPVFENEKQSDVPLACLTDLAASLREEDKSGVFVAEVVKAIIRRGTLESFITRWQTSNLLWSEVIGKDDETVEKFLVKHNLQDLSDSEGPPRRGQNAEDTEQTSPADEQYRIEQNIMKLLEDKASNEDIFVWVEKCVKEEDRTKSPFLRALTISICRGSMNLKTMAVEEEKINGRSIVLKKYMDTNPERELQALYALQHLMVILEQPANVLRKFFDVLYHADVVSEQTFYKWEKSDDPNEQEGRGVAVASVNPFFTWLRTAEPESD